MATGSITDNSTPVTLTATTGEHVVILVYGTYSGVAVVFEVSADGTHWNSILAHLSDATWAGTGLALVDNTTYSFLIRVPGGNQVRIRPTTYTSGTASVVLLADTRGTTDASGNQIVVGNVASGATDSGNPVLMGGYGSTSLPTAVTAGQRTRIWTDLNGRVAVGIAGNNNYTDGQTNANTGGHIGPLNGSLCALNSSQWNYNGSTWDRRRTPLVFKTLSAVTITSETTIWTPTSGKKFRLMGGLVSMGTAAGNVTLKDNTAGSTIFIIPKAPLDTPVPIGPLGNGILSAAANNVLTATGASTETISGVIWGTEE